tara:strand:+ start:99 stop:296 length:198 start_codon:yes stop_codon:yes gene_type:complete
MQTKTKNKPTPLTPEQQQLLFDTAIRVAPAIPSDPMYGVSARAVYNLAYELIRTKQAIAERGFYK